MGIRKGGGIQMKVQATPRLRNKQGLSDLTTTGHCWPPKPTTTDNNRSPTDRRFVGRATAGSAGGRTT